MEQRKPTRREAAPGRPEAGKLKRRILWRSFKRDLYDARWILWLVGVIFGAILTGTILVNIMQEVAK